MVGMDFAAPYIAREEKMLIEGSNRNLVLPRCDEKRSPKKLTILIF